ncbi:hypothetical protein GJAV_G00260990 [Gymnothorax javanicus]|nr:hypothetical protein GJAV_G00260990 [Gymnothorax javanicus]
MEEEEGFESGSSDGPESLQQKCYKKDGVEEERRAGRRCHQEQRDVSDDRPSELDAAALTVSDSVLPPVSLCCSPQQDSYSADYDLELTAEVRMEDGSSIALLPSVSHRFISRKLGILMDHVPLNLKRQSSTWISKEQTFNYCQHPCFPPTKPLIVSVPPAFIGNKISLLDSLQAPKSPLPCCPSTPSSPSSAQSSPSSPPSSSSSSPVAGATSLHDGRRDCVARFTQSEGGAVSSASVSSPLAARSLPVSSSPSAHHCSTGHAQENVEIYDPHHPTEPEGVQEAGSAKEAEEEEEGKGDKYDPFDPTGSPASAGEKKQTVECMVCVDSEKRDTMGTVGELKAGNDMDEREKSPSHHMALPPASPISSDVSSHTHMHGKRESEDEMEQEGGVGGEGLGGRVKDCGAERWERKESNSDNSEIEEGEIVPAEERNRKRGGRRDRGGEREHLPDCSSVLSGPKPDRILRVLEGNNFVSARADDGWTGEQEGGTTAVSGDLWRKRVCREKERRPSCPSSTSLSPSTPLSVTTPPPSIPLPPEKREKSRKSSKSYKETERRERKGGQKTGRRLRRRGKGGGSQERKEKDKDGKRRGQENKRKGSRSRSSRSGSNKRKKRLSSPEPSSHSHSHTSLLQHYSRRSWSSAAEDRHRERERERDGERDRERARGGERERERDREREREWDRERERDQDRKRDRDRHRERDRDHKRERDRERDRVRDLEKCRDRDREQMDRDWDRGRNQNGRRDGKERRRERDYRERAKGDGELRDKDRGARRRKRMSRERREPDRERDRRRRDGRPVVPPSVQDLSCPDLLAIKRTIVVTAATTTTLPGSPQLSQSTLDTPPLSSNRQHKRKHRRRRRLAEEDYAEEEKLSRSRDSSLSPLGYHLDYESDQITDQLEVDVLSLDGEAMDSDDSLGDSALPPPPVTPNPSTETNPKQKLSHSKKKSHTGKKTTAMDPLLQQEAAKSPPPLSDSSDPIVPTLTLPVPKATKKARKVVKEKAGKKERGRPGRLKKMSSGSQKGKLQSKVSVLVRDGVSSTTGGIGSSKLGVVVSTKDLPSQGGASSGTEVGGSIAVVFRRDNESRSPFLKPSSESVSLSARNKDFCRAQKTSALMHLSASPSHASVLKSKKARPSSTTSASSAASSPSSLLLTKGRRKLGRKQKRRDLKVVEGATAASCVEGGSWALSGLDIQSRTSSSSKPSSPPPEPPALIPSSSSSTSSSSTCAPPPSSPPCTPPCTFGSQISSETRESTPDSQTVDSSCKTPEPIFLSDDGPTTSHTIPLTPPCNVPSSPLPPQVAQEGVSGISQLTPDLKNTTDVEKNPSSSPGPSSSALSVASSSADLNSSVTSSSANKPPPPPPPPSVPPLPWSVQTGVDCTAGGVLALTALLFKMEEANLANRAKAQEFIQATSQILSQANQSQSQQLPLPSSSSSSSQPLPPPPPPQSSLASPPGAAPAQFILHSSLPLAGCTKTLPSHPLPGLSLAGGCAQTSPHPMLGASSGAVGPSSETGWDSESKDPEKFLKKLHTQERAVEEVKLAIKPYYQRKDITKEDYKDILRKAVNKICHSRSGEINPVKVNNLVKLYVQRYKYFRKHGRKMDEEEKEGERNFSPNLWIKSKIHIYWDCFREESNSMKFLHQLILLLVTFGTKATPFRSSLQRSLLPVVSTLERGVRSSKAQNLEAVLPERVLHLALPRSALWKTNSAELRVRPRRASPRGCQLGTCQLHNLANTLYQIGKTNGKDESKKANDPRGYGR